MRKLPTYLLLVFLAAIPSARFTAAAAARGSKEVVRINLTVPEFDVKGTDQYICTSVRLPSTPHKLVGIVPLARQEIVHHILLYGCNAPYQTPTEENPNPVWNCFEHGTCLSGDTIIYGWGRNAPPLALPEGVGFSVGEKTSIQYIVAQVHFLEERPADDRSGVQLVLQPLAVPFSAGLIAFARGFQIPPQQPSVLIENECCFKSHQPLTTFAMRVHTHGLGSTVHMKRERHDHAGVETVGQRNPQLPQAFVAVKQTMLWPGDKLKVTCDFNSSDMTRTVFAGSTHNDEMCNMYMMVYAPQPHMIMCGDGHFGVTDSSPGNMPKSGTFVADPSPFWQPPVPKAAGNPLNDVTSVTIAADGALWALYRGSHPWDGGSFDSTHHETSKTAIPEAVVVRLDPDTGNVLSSWGADTFYMPHMITLDVDSNVWVVDTGRHQVLKFNSAGGLLMEVGTKLTPGNSLSTFCQPTQVAVLRDGSFFVSDGYCNSRVVHFAKDGTYIDEVAVPDGSVIHGVLVDECSTFIYVLSRMNGKVFAFDYSKEYALKNTWDLKAHGMVWSIRMGPYGSILVLAWAPGQEAKLVSLSEYGGENWWKIPGMETGFPHDIAIGAAPVAFSGPGDRLFALYVAPVCEPPGCGPLRRFIMLPNGIPLPTPAALKAVGPSPLPAKPKQGKLPNEAAEEALLASQPKSSSGMSGKPENLPTQEVTASTAEPKTAGTSSYSHGGVGQVSGKPKKAAPVAVKPDTDKEESGDPTGDDVTAVDAQEEEGYEEEEEEYEEYLKEEEEAEAKEEDEKGDGEEGDYDGDYKDAEDEEGEEEEEEANFKDDASGSDQKKTSSSAQTKSDTAKNVANANSGEDHKATAEGPGDSLEEDFDIQFNPETLKIKEEGRHSFAQVISMLTLALIVAGLVAVVALHIVRKYVSSSELRYQPASLKPPHDKDIICNSIEDMLEQSRVLDDDVETNYMAGGRHRAAQDWAAKAKAGGLQ